MCLFVRFPGLVTADLPDLEGIPFGKMAFHADVSSPDMLRDVVQEGFQEDVIVVDFPDQAVKQRIHLVQPDHRAGESGALVVQGQLGVEGSPQDVLVLIKAPGVLPLADLIGDFIALSDDRVQVFLAAQVLGILVDEGLDGTQMPDVILELGRALQG